MVLGGGGEGRGGIEGDDCCTMCSPLYIENIALTKAKGTSLATLPIYY